MEGCAGQKESPLGVETEQGLPPLTLEVLDVLSLVEDHVVPFLSPEREVILDHELVRCNANVERVVFAPTMPLDFSLFLSTKISEDLESWAPLFEFDFPVHDNCCRYHDEVRTPHTFVAGERCQE